MAIDIRIGANAFDFADAWLKGVARGQAQSELDLKWAKWADDVSARMRGEVRDKAAYDEAVAQRNSARGAASDAEYQADVAGATKITASQRERANYITARLVNEHGFSRQGAAALVGNWLQESQLNTIARNRGDGSDGTDSIGLAQWNSSRATGLKAFAAARKTSWTDLNTQIDYAAQELTTGNYKDIGAMLRDSRVSLQAASQAVHRRYEVAEPTSAGRRLSFSMSVFNEFDPTKPSARTLPTIGADGSGGIYSNFPMNDTAAGPDASSRESTIPGAVGVASGPAKDYTVVKTRPRTGNSVAAASPGAATMPGATPSAGPSGGSDPSVPSLLAPLPPVNGMPLNRLEDALDPFGMRFRPGAYDPMQRYYDADKADRERMRQPAPPPTSPALDLSFLSPAADETLFDPYAYLGTIG